MSLYTHSFDNGSDFSLISKFIYFLLLYTTFHIISHFSIFKRLFDSGGFRVNTETSASSTEKLRTISRVRDSLFHVSLKSLKAILISRRITGRAKEGNWFDLKSQLTKVHRYMKPL